MPPAIEEVYGLADSAEHGGLFLAEIHKIKAGRWELRRWKGAVTNQTITYHRTLKEAKALGLVEVRFNLANKL